MNKNNTTVEAAGLVHQQTLRQVMKQVTSQAVCCVRTSVEGQIRHRIDIQSSFSIQRESVLSLSVHSQRPKPLRIKIRTQLKDRVTITTDAVSGQVDMVTVVKCIT